MSRGWGTEGRRSLPLLYARTTVGPKYAYHGYLTALSSDLRERIMAPAASIVSPYMD